MLPILPLLLILLFPGAAGPRVGTSLETGARYERRIIAALVETVRQEAEREALASSVLPKPQRATIVAATVRTPRVVVRESDRVRDGPWA